MGAICDQTYLGLDMWIGDGREGRGSGMKIMRNPELQREWILLGMIMACGVAIMGFWQGWKSALGTGGICLALVVVLVVASIRRYRLIALMGEQIDRILHGEDMPLLENCDEGDLAILSAQVKKMVRCLHEQQGNLQKEKDLLANFMADISHQMKTPLTSIHLILSFLQEEDLAFDRRRELVKKLTILTDRMDWMVYALLRMAKLEAGTVTLQKKYFHISHLIQKSYESLAIPMELRGISFRSEVAEGAGMTGDIAWMTEAVTNVMKNCMEHTPEGGEVFVKVEENALYTVIFVEDTGTGIEEEDLPHIFERFYRGKNADENSVGIGLALSKQIITSQNGTIRVRNKRRENGAAFEIRCYKGSI